MPEEGKRPAEALPEVVSLKLTAKGLYYWDINMSEPKVGPETVNRLSEINNHMRAAFPKNVVDYQPVESSTKDEGAKRPSAKQERRLPTTPWKQ